MKIGFFTDGYLPQINGVATSTEELAVSLRKIKNKVTVVAPNFPNFKDKGKNVLRLKSVKIYRNPDIRIAYMFPDRILGQVITKDFDAIHGFSGGSIPSLGLALAKMKRKPYVFTYNTRWNQYTHYILNGRVVKPKAVEKAMTVFCNRCDAIIAPANFVKEELLSFGVKRPITVIPNGVDIEKFDKAKKGLIRKKLKIKKDGKIVLYLGRLAKEKSIDFLIRVFAKVEKKNPNTYLLIAGDGPYKEKLENLVKNLNLTGKVIFLGLVAFKDVPSVYKEADIFAFASQTETQGMVVLEAMASGLPVIVAKDRVFQDVIENGVDGFLVEKKEAEFGEKLENLLRDDKLREKISEKAKKKAQQFSLDEIAKKFDTLYKSLK